MDATDLVVYDYMVTARIGTSKYLLKETIDLPSAKFRYKWLKVLHFTLKYLLLACLTYYFLIPTVLAILQNVIM